MLPGRVLLCSGPLMSCRFWLSVLRDLRDVILVVSVVVILCTLPSRMGLRCDWGMRGSPGGIPGFNVGEGVQDVGILEKFMFDGHGNVVRRAD